MLTPDTCSERAQAFRLLGKALLSGESLTPAALREELQVTQRMIELLFAEMADPHVPFAPERDELYAKLQYYRLALRRAETLPRSVPAADGPL